MSLAQENILDRIDNWESILNSITNPVIIMGLDKTVYFLNHAAEETLDMPKEKCMGKSCQIFNTPYCYNSNCCIEKFLRGEEGQIQYGPRESITRVNISLLKNMKTDETLGYISISTDIRKLIETQRQLKISEQRYEMALCQSQIAMWSYNPNSNSLIQLNDGQLAVQIFDKTKKIENFPEVTIQNNQIHNDSVQDIINFCEKIKNGEKSCSTTVKFKQWADKYCWINIKSTTVFDENGKLIEVIIVANDITEQKMLEMKYEKEKAYRTAIYAGYIAVYEINLTQNQIVNMPDSLSQELNIDKEDLSYDYLQQKIYAHVYDKDFGAVAQKLNRNYLLEQFNAGQTEVTLEYRNCTQDSCQWIQISTSIFYRDGHDDIYAYIYLKDINEQKLKENELKSRAETDNLTALYNRNAMQDLINLTLSYNDEKYHALMILDIDNFKEINDTYGHIFGDKVLVEISTKIRNICGENSILGRLGGDEFIIFMRDVTNPIIAEEKAKVLCDELRIVYSLNEKTVQISASIELAFAPEHGLTFSELYDRADIAMYCVKKRGKNQWAKYQDQMSNNTLKLL